MPAELGTPKKLDISTTSADGWMVEYKTFWNGSGSDITDGDWVQLDTDDTTYGVGGSVEIAAANATSAVVGVADETVADGNPVRVVTYGVKVTANVADAVTINQLLKVSSTAGRVDSATVGTHHVVGHALSAGDASNDATVFVKP